MSLKEYAPAPYWIDMPVRDFCLWLQDAIELAEEVKKRAKQENL